MGHQLTAPTPTVSSAGRRFELHRDVDVHDVSGTGIVADGTQFPEPFTVRFPAAGRLELDAGWVLLTWRGVRSSTVLWRSVADALAVHGHDGLTRLVWLDQS